MSQAPCQERQKAWKENRLRVGKCARFAGGGLKLQAKAKDRMMEGKCLLEQGTFPSRSKATYSVRFNGQVDWICCNEPWSKRCKAFKPIQVPKQCLQGLLRRPFMHVGMTQAFPRCAPPWSPSRSGAACVSLLYRRQVGCSCTLSTSTQLCPEQFTRLARGTTFHAH